MWKQLLSVFLLANIAASDVRPKLNPIRVHISPSKGRIIGGSEVPPNSVPFQVGLRINDGGSFCGGALISANYVLTAGHCGIIISTVDVVLGAHNISNLQEATQVAIRGAKTIVHEGFMYNTLINDITLIQLSEPAPFNDHIQPAILPKLSDIDRTYSNEIATATGWGLYQDTPSATLRDLSDVLLAVDVKVSNWTDCAEYYNDVNGEHVVSANVCTSGYKNKGTCNGDSGGPLILDGVLIALTSFGTPSCEVCSPSVYTRVSNYLDWIAENSDVNIM